MRDSKSATVMVRLDILTSTLLSRPLSFPQPDTAAKHIMTAIIVILCIVLILIGDIIS